MKTIDDALKYADTFDSPHNKHMSIVMLAAEVRRLRDEVNGLTGSLDRAEKALKEAHEQEPVAYMIHEYQGTGEKRLQFQPHIPSIRDDVTGPIVTALYARPVPANHIDFDRIKTVPVVAVLGADDQLDTLMRFYQVSDIPSLAIAQAKHIEKLQAKIPAMRNDMPRNPRGA